MDYDELFRRFDYCDPTLRIQLMGWAVCHRPKPERDGEYCGIPIRLADCPSADAEETEP